MEALSEEKQYTYLSTLMHYADLDTLHLNHYKI